MPGDMTMPGDSDGPMELHARRTRPARRRAELHRPDLRQEVTAEIGRFIPGRSSARRLPDLPSDDQPQDGLLSEAPPSEELPAWAQPPEPVDTDQLPTPPTVDFSHTTAAAEPGRTTLPLGVPDGSPVGATPEPDVAEPPRQIPSPIAERVVVPAPPKRFDLGRRLRAVAGVDEALMARVPQERARYTALGGVVIGTALIASFSMWFAITEALGETSGWVILPTLIWGLFIFNFDRWLVSSAMGSRWHKRIGTLVVRVLMAVLFGIIIAEPLVLRVFQTAIVAHIQDERTADLAKLQTNLVRCNPEPNGTAAPKTPANCNGYVLTFPTSPNTAVNELASKQADAAKLQTQIDTDTRQLATIENEARMECAGYKGPGLTGRAGVGPNCTRLRSEADAYAKAHPIATETAQLSTLQQQISTLEAQVASSRTDFLKERTQLINQAVATEKSHQGPIGIIERMGSLSALTKGSLTLLIGVWLVRLLFIMVDCMPILVKFFGGVTWYDRLVERELTNADLQHAAEFDTAYDERAARLHRRRAEIDVETREHRAALGTRVSRAVHDLATEYVEPGGTVYRGRSGRTDDR